VFCFSAELFGSLQQMQACILFAVLSGRIKKNIDPYAFTLTSKTFHSWKKGMTLLIECYFSSFFAFSSLSNWIVISPY